MYFCFTSNDNCHFSSEKRLHPKRVVEFSSGKRHIRNIVMEIVEDFDEKSYNNNGKPWKSSRIFGCEANFFIFSLFIIFLHFFRFFSFFHFLHFLFFHVLICFIFFIFPFFHFLSFSLIFLLFSFMFFHFLSFSFILIHFLSFSVFVGCSKSDFLGLNFVSISLDNSYVKKSILPLLGPLFFFFLLFFQPFFVFFLAFYFFIFFIFQCFSFSSFFSEEKFSSFLFSLYFFQIFFLLALVSEFNCSSVVGAPWRCGILAT